MQSQALFFGYIWSAIFLLLSYKFSKFFLLPSLVFFIITLLRPQFFINSKILPYWIIFGNFIGKINGKIIMFLLFFTIFTPIGLLLRLIGKDLLQKKLDKKANSYFTKRHTQPSSMINQF
jgi:hypothetical protein